MGKIARFFQPFYRRRNVSLVWTRGRENPRTRQIQRDAAADVEEIEQDDEYFGRDAPANEDELLSGHLSGVPRRGTMKAPSAWASPVQVHGDGFAD